MSGPDYQWRNLTSREREEVLAHRQLIGRPWHSPPHRPTHGSSQFHLTAACFEHRPCIGASFSRMDSFASELVHVLSSSCDRVFAWCLLPNHYHALVQVENVRTLTRVLGHIHGRSSHTWNGEDLACGRQVFFRTADRAMRSERHYWATLNYIHHNPVHHGYVERWTDWPWSSAAEYLEIVGREEAARRWSEFPVLDYGQSWDDPEL